MENNEHQPISKLKAFWYGVQCAILIGVVMNFTLFGWDRAVRMTPEEIAGENTLPSIFNKDTYKYTKKYKLEHKKEIDLANKKRADKRYLQIVKKRMEAKAEAEQAKEQPKEQAKEQAKEQPKAKAEAEPRTKSRAKPPATISYKTAYESVEVAFVYDGDTFIAKLPSGEVSIRIRGIDTPELKDAKCNLEKVKANQAKKALIQLIQPKSKVGYVWLRNCALGKYNRLVCSVTTEQKKDVSVALIASGHARAYSGGTRLSWCKKY